MKLYNNSKHQQQRIAAKNLYNKENPISAKFIENFQYEELSYRQLNAKYVGVLNYYPHSNTSVLSVTQQSKGIDVAAIITSGKDEIKCLDVEDILVEIPSLLKSKYSDRNIEDISLKTQNLAYLETKPISRTEATARTYRNKLTDCINNVIDLATSVTASRLNKSEKEVRQLMASTNTNLTHCVLTYNKAVKHRKTVHEDVLLCLNTAIELAHIQIKPYFRLAVAIIEGATRKELEELGEDVTEPKYLEGLEEEEEEDSGEYGEEDNDIPENLKGIKYHAHLAIPSTQDPTLDLEIVNLIQHVWTNIYANGKEHCFKDSIRHKNPRKLYKHSQGLIDYLKKPNISKRDDYKRRLHKNTQDIICYPNYTDRIKLNVQFSTRATTDINMLSMLYAATGVAIKNIQIRPTSIEVEGKKIRPITITASESDPTYKTKTEEYITNRKKKRITIETAKPIVKKTESELQKINTIRKERLRNSKVANIGIEYVNTNFGRNLNKIEIPRYLNKEYRFAIYHPPD
jgi:hypothetical protein